MKKLTRGSCMCRRTLWYWFALGDLKGFILEPVIRHNQNKRSMKLLDTYCIILCTHGAKYLEQVEFKLGCPSVPLCIKGS